MTLSKSFLRDFCDAAEELGMFRQSNRNEAFLASVVEGNARKVQFFLDGGADVNYREALQWAIDRDVNGDHDEVVKVLLLNGAQLYYTRSKDLMPGGPFTPFVSASKEGKLAIVQTMLLYGSVAAADKSMALDYADACRHCKVIKTLLEAGAKSDRPLESLVDRGDLKGWPQP